MKYPLILATSIALALAVPAFAQDNAQTAPPASSQASDQAAPADSSSMSSDAQQPASTTAPQHRMRHRRAYKPAAMALTGDDAKTAAYQKSDREKSYPAVDHGHVPGDPPVIDHSGDQAPVANPTSATITVPPTH